MKGTPSGSKPCARMGPADWPTPTTFMIGAARGLGKHVFFPLRALGGNEPFEKVSFKYEDYRYHVKLHYWKRDRRYFLKPTVWRSICQHCKFPLKSLVKFTYEGDRRFKMRPFAQHFSDKDGSPCYTPTGRNEGGQAFCGMTVHLDEVHPHEQVQGPLMNNMDENSANVGELDLGDCPPQVVECMTSSHFNQITLTAEIILAAKLEAGQKAYLESYRKPNHGAHEVNIVNSSTSRLRLGAGWPTYAKAAGLKRGGSCRFTLNTHRSTRERKIFFSVH